MSTCDGTRNIRAVPRRSQRHERHTKTVVTSPLRKYWPRKSNPIYTLEGLALKDLGIEVKIGVHTGEVEYEEESLIGITVHIGFRVANLAGAGEVLVSSTVRDLMAGSGITFTDRGMHSLRGIPGEWRLFTPDIPSAR